MRKYAQSLKRSLQSLVQIYLRYDFFIFHWEYLKCHKDVKKPTQSWCLHFCLCHVTAPNLCWLISALCSLCVFVHCLFCPRIMGFAHFWVDLMLHNSVRSFKFAPYAEMHRRTRTSLSCSFWDQHFCFHVMYERESCLLLEILFFFFPRRCDWVNFNGALFFLCCMKDKKAFVFQLACSCLPVATTEEDSSGACFHAFFSIKDEQSFHEFTIDLMWIVGDLLYGKQPHRASVLILKPFEFFL